MCTPGNNWLNGASTLQSHLWSVLWLCKILICFGYFFYFLAASWKSFWWRRDRGCLTARRVSVSWLKRNASARKTRDRRVISAASASAGASWRHLCFSLFWHILVKKSSVPPEIQQLKSQILVLKSQISNNFNTLLVDMKHLLLFCEIHVKAFKNQAAVEEIRKP